MRITVIIATTGRAELLRHTVARLAHQTRLPDSIVVSAVGPADVAGVEGVEGVPTETIFAEKGLPRQRNAGLRHVEGKTDVVVFFDDDFVPADTYLQKLEEIFTLRPNVVGATAKLLADGIKTPGIAFEEAVGMVEAHVPVDIVREQPLPALYGCNLCVRLSAAQDIWFDERLPLYGWQEDVDYSYRLGQNGTLVYTNLLTGVHLGAKGGRTSGKRLGYSQIANPVYLLRKKTIPPRLAMRLMWRNCVANMARSVFPEATVDRRGRLQGNITALVDLARGRIHPERILQL